MIVEKINITKASIKRTLSMIMALLMIITSLSVSAFAVDTSGKNFDYYIEDGEVTILDNYCSDNESITIPEKIEGYPVTIIAEKAFSECKASEITIPETVVQICYSAFYGCQNLKNISIPDSVTSLGDSAFNNCSGLTSVTIGNNIKEIGRDTFINCSGLTSVTIPDSVTKIGDYAF
ncbi:MAG: leucine-rich repeat domain-containing protein, partial [Candidatus Gastranaerophilaceae bacterium]